MKKMEAARNELHNLLEKPQLQGIPLLFGEQRDLPGALDENAYTTDESGHIIRSGDLIQFRCKQRENIDIIAMAHPVKRH
jgi:ADP-ribosylation factor-like protein 8